jgi:hypothetical protein
MASREDQGWCQARRLCRSNNSGCSQGFPEENKEAPTQEVIRAFRARRRLLQARLVPGSRGHRSPAYSSASRPATPASARPGRVASGRSGLAPRCAARRNASEDGPRHRSLETIHSGSEYCGRAPLLLRRAANGEMEMNAQAPKLEAAENDLKQLMADVTRAMKRLRKPSRGYAPRASARPLRSAPQAPADNATGHCDGHERATIARCPLTIGSVR